MRRAYLRPAIVLLLLVAATLAPNVARSQSQSNVFSLFSPDSVPGRPGGTDQASVELGLRFSVDNPGAITAIRFYKGAISNAQHTVSLWTDNGQLLARGTTASETSSGWQEATLDTPVTLTPGVVYVASYHTNGYAANQNYFTNGLSSGPLHALASANGRYLYGSEPTFPSDSYLASNYWVDVVFAQAAPTATPTGTSTSTVTSTPVAATSTSTSTATSTATSTVTPTRTALVVGASTATPTPIPPTGFTCTEMVGFSETQQWYDGGFIGAVPNPTNWQLRWYPGGSIDLWALGSNFAGWSSTYLVSHCANGSSAPDRIILNVSGDYNTDVAWWARQTQATIDYVRSVYSPSVKQVVVQPVVGGPASSLCGSATNPPSSWVRASYNFPVIKAGLQQVLSASVVLGADPQVRSCADYADTIGHLATAAEQPIGAAIAGYYSQPPR